MSRKTEYLKLHLPEENEFYNVEKDQNENFEKIDRKIKELDTFEKKTGYNLDKTDNYNQDDTNLLGTAKALKALYDELNRKIESLDLCPYKVGDVYITTNTANPADLWSGTSWTKLEGRFLKATNNGEAPKTMGGSNSKTLTVANIPSHNHTIWIGENGYHSHSQDAHAHTQPAHVHYMQEQHRSTEGGGGSSALPASNSRYVRNLKTEAAGGENTGGAQPAIHGNGNHSHSASIGNTGSGNAFDVTPAYYAVNMWIRIG